MAYSTCSINPLENEAVVQALLQATQGALTVVEKKLENFVHRSGLVTWKVVNEDLAVVDGENFKKSTARYRLSMLPSRKFDDHLKKCIRVYPHDNDTGGFFICVLKKLKHFPENETSTDLCKSTEICISKGEECFFARTPDARRFKIAGGLADFLDSQGNSFNVVSAGLASEVP
jgi:hypothetical protein